jgi:hypothetical protein
MKNVVVTLAMNKHLQQQLQNYDLDHLGRFRQKTQIT